MTALFWFIVFITPIVFIHELGHFLFARLFGVKVEVFSIGFGKPLITWKDRKDTKWQIAVIPLGGYVKMYGDENVASVPDQKKLKTMSEEERQSSVHNKKLWQKSLIVFGGPFANYLLTFLLFVVISIFSGVKEIKPEITKIMEHSSAEVAGLKVGDFIVDINGEKINSAFDISNKINASPSGDVTVGFIRNNSYSSVKLTANEAKGKNIFGEAKKMRLIGVTFEKYSSRDVNFAEAVKSSFLQLLDYTYLFLKFIGKVVSLKVGTDSIGGPIKIAKLSEDMSNQGVFAALYFIAIISLNLGFMNLLPIPMLDGGHLFFYAIEGIIRKPINYKIQELCFKIGFAILIMIMFTAFWNDLKEMEFFTKIKLLLS